MNCKTQLLEQQVADDSDSGCSDIGKIVTAAKQNSVAYWPPHCGLSSTNERMTIFHFDRPPTSLVGFSRTNLSMKYPVMP